MSESITGLPAWEASNLMTCLGINTEFRFYRFLSDQMMRGERIKMSAYLIGYHFSEMHALYVYRNFISLEMDVQTHVYSQAISSGFF